MMTVASRIEATGSAMACSVILPLLRSISIDRWCTGISWCLPPPGGYSGGRGGEVGPMASSGWVWREFGRLLTVTFQASCNSNFLYVL